MGQSDWLLNGAKIFSLQALFLSYLIIVQGLSYWFVSLVYYKKIEVLEILVESQSKDFLQDFWTKLDIQLKTLI